MTINRIAGISLALGAAFAIGAPQADAHGGAAWARVVAVQPIVTRVLVEQPRNECWQDVEYRSTTPLRVAGTTAAGGIIGAAIGRQFGDGSGRDGLTVLGALAGAAVANEHARRNLARRGEDGLVAVPVERCEVRYDTVATEQVRGYWVTYQYRGRIQRVRTDRHPGHRIRVYGGPRRFAY